MLEPTFDIVDTDSPLSTRFSPWARLGVGSKRLGTRRTGTDALAKLRDRPSPRRDAREPRLPIGSTINIVDVARSFIGHDPVDPRNGAPSRAPRAARSSGGTACGGAWVDDRTGRRCNAELPAMYVEIERMLTQQGYRAKLAAWAIVRLRERHAADLSRPTMVELLREAFLLLAPGSSVPR